MSGTSRPSASTCAFHSLNDVSSSPSSCPRSSRRTGWAESGVTRYWYQEMSQAIVTTTSVLTPESCTMLARGSPRLFAIPPIVRRNALELKRSAASTIASSGSERRRRIGSLATGSAGSGRLVSNRLPSPRRRLRGSVSTIGVVGLPSLSQPDSAAMSWQSGQTSTKCSPSGAKRTARSPTSRDRSQTAHVRVTAFRVMRIAPTITKASKRSDLRFFLLGFRLGDQLLRDVRGHLVVADEVHVVVAAATGQRRQRL